MANASRVFLISRYASFWANILQTRVIYFYSLLCSDSLFYILHFCIPFAPLGFFSVIYKPVLSPFVLVFPPEHFWEEMEGDDEEEGKK